MEQAWERMQANPPIILDPEGYGELQKNSSAYHGYWEGVKS